MSYFWSSWATAMVRILFLPFPSLSLNDASEKNPTYSSSSTRSKFFSRPHLHSCFLVLHRTASTSHVYRPSFVQYDGTQEQRLVSPPPPPIALAIAVRPQS